MRIREVVLGRNGEMHGDEVDGLIAGDEVDEDMADHCGMHNFGLHSPCKT